MEELPKRNKNSTIIVRTLKVFMSRIICYANKNTEIRLEYTSIKDTSDFNQSVDINKRSIRGNDRGERTMQIHLNSTESTREETSSSWCQFQVTYRLCRFRQIRIPAVWPAWHAMRYVKKCS